MNDQMKEEMKQDMKQEETKTNQASEAAESAEDAQMNAISELDALKNEIEALRAEVVTAKNDYFKAFADAENKKKRLQQDFDANMKYRVQSFALEILPAIDNFERALTQEVSDETTKTYLKGYQMIYEQIINALKSEGVEVIPTKDQPFDPNFHHAIMVEKVEGMQSGMIIQELQKGYKLKDRILRASMVKVSE